MMPSALLERLLSASRWLGVREIAYHEASNTVFFLVDNMSEKAIHKTMESFPEFAFRIIPSDIAAPPNALTVLRRRRPRGRPLP